MARRILVIDGSRVVRATLTKHLKDDFEILQEADGESAWQTLMLDANIAAVISGLHTPRLEAADLLQRLRTSAVRRLRSIPFILIVSDVDNLTPQEAEGSKGVAAFITKSMQKSAMIDCLNSVLGPEDAKREPKEARERSGKAGETPVSPETQIVLETARFRSVLSALRFAEKQHEDTCALVFGIDNREALIERFGEDIAGMIASRFASLLLSKVSPRDLIGRCRGERLAIISYGVDLKQGVAFGRRVCKSLAAGQIAIRGEKVTLTASVGVASTSDDGVGNGQELFTLADRRLDQALACGGNNVSAEYKPNCPLHAHNRNARQLIEVLEALGGEGLRELPDIPQHIGDVGLAILPLLEVMDRELRLGLPLANIKVRLEQRATSESSTATTTLAPGYLRE